MRACALLLVLLLASCDDDGATDAGTDSGPPGMDLSFEAVADPAERTDCASEPPGAGEVRAKHVVCDEELIEGALAMGRIGDVMLENARARFVVRTAEGAASTIGAPTGGLVDAAPRDGVDLLKELFPLFDLASMGPTAVEVVDAGASGEARVRVLFDAAPIGLIDTVLPGLARGVRVRGQVDYVLAPDADALEVQMSLTTTEGVGSVSPGLGAIALLGGAELFQPGSGVLDEDNLGGDGMTVISERPEGALVVDVDIDGGSLTHIETIHLLRGPRTRVARGELTTATIRVAVGETAAQALEAARPNAEGSRVVLSGPPGERVEVLTADGTPVLRSHFDASGEVALHLSGEHTATPGFAGYFDGAPVSFDGDVTVPGAPRATLEIAALVDGAPDVPVRVSIQDSEGEEVEPRFVARGETTHLVPPGDYHVTISHGLEYDALSTDVTLAADATERLEPDLLRAIDTDGWVSVDLHLHSDLSTDSVHPIETALALLEAEGVQAASSTDHDFVTNPARIAALAGGTSMILVPGVEVSTTVYGHVNGYPLRPDGALTAAGAPVWFDLAPADVFAALRARGDESLGGALVQINHPRLGSASFFGALQLDRATAQPTTDPTSLGFSADTDLNDFGFQVLEIWNGCCRGGDEESFVDYLALYAAGRRFAMVGNSDSHDWKRPPGTPRSFVRVPDEANVGWMDIAAGLRAGEVTVAAAAFVTATLEGPRAGDTVPVRVVVQAPPWAEVDRLRVFAGREAVIDRAIAPSSDAVRLDEVIDVSLGGADFVLVRVDGPSAPEPLQHFPALGVTNPLVVP